MEARRANYLAWLRPHDLRGRNLRYSLLTLLHERGASSIAELRAELERRGLRVGGERPEKTIADVLRYECSLGRARRIGRGRYEGQPRPDTTTRRHRDRLRDLVSEGERRRLMGETWSND